MRTCSLTGTTDTGPRKNLLPHRVPCYLTKFRPTTCGARQPSVSENSFSAAGDVSNVVNSQNSNSPTAIIPHCDNGILWKRSFCSFSVAKYEEGLFAFSSRVCLLSPTVDSIRKEINCAMATTGSVASYCSPSATAAIVSSVEFSLQDIYTPTLYASADFPDPGYIRSRFVRATTGSVASTCCSRPSATVDINVASSAIFPRIAL